VAPEVLKEKCTDITQGNWFYLPDGTPDPFWTALKERCGAYMKEHNESRDMKWSTFLLHVFLLAIQPALWWFGYVDSYPWTSHATALAMAVTTWIAGRLGHDGGHFAVSRKYWVNRVVGNWAGLGLSNISYWEILVSVPARVRACVRVAVLLDGMCVALAVEIRVRACALLLRCVGCWSVGEWSVS